MKDTNTNPRGGETDAFRSDAFRTDAFTNYAFTNHASTSYAFTSYAFRGWAIFGFIVILLSICILGATQFENVLAWSVGLIYVAYDTWLLAYVAWKTHKLGKYVVKENSSLARAEAEFATRSAIKLGVAGATQNMGVLVPVHNESDVVIATLTHLLQQNKTPQKIIIVNDGSTDSTLKKITEHYGFNHSATMDDSPLYQSTIHAHLFLFNKDNSGKADSLNQALAYLDCDIVITVDADTLLEVDAIAEIHKAFVSNSNLVAACGILKPITRGGLSARIFGVFQYFEYIRAFLSRAAWSQSNALLLVSGAFSAYNKQALINVGGYDSASLVEDYELIHRMHKFSCEHDLGWEIDVIESARATTDAPTNIVAFIAQRKRWFAGFLRTQFKYRQMIGTAKYKAVGLFMLPIKTIDTLQPIFGLVALYLLWQFIITDAQVAAYVLVVIGIKIALDFCFHLWALRKYHLWLGKNIAQRRWLQATACCLADPFFFQPLRHLSALIGWSMVLKGNVRWEPIRMQLKQ
jgi:cellulose synthase/poly-beta-1,6-N-acetylglucosamine synthase-like glycosyltransferase